MRRLRSRIPVWAAVVLLAPLFVLGCGNDPAAPPEESAIDGDEALVAALASAYRTLDPVLFESLLSNDPEANAVFTFTVTEASGSTRSVWDADTEMSIHRRMFRPTEVPATDPPVNPDLWLKWTVVTLSPKSDFVEREDLYLSASNPGGVDPARWRVTSARYVTDVHFQLPEGNWFAVNDREAEFVVIEDRMKDVGDETKFRLLAWSESCPATAIQTRECWSTVKSLYAK